MSSLSQSQLIDCRCLKHVLNTFTKPVTKAEGCAHTYIFSPLVREYMRIHGNPIPFLSRALAIGSLNASFILPSFKRSNTVSLTRQPAPSCSHPFVHKSLKHFIHSPSYRKKKDIKTNTFRHFVQAHNLAFPQMRSDETLPQARICKTWTAPQGRNEVFMIFCFLLFFLSSTKVFCRDNQKTLHESYLTWMENVAISFALI